MIDLLLFAGRVALLILLYLFLLFAIKSGIGLAQGSRKSKQSVYTVTIVDGPPTLEGTTFNLNAILLIGRAPGNDIHVNDELLSGSHARLTPVQDGAVLEDLGSTNGTLLNGMPVRTPQALRPGDRIEAGSLKMVVDRQ
ncbi:MAG: FHA domain-containing protein [Coriobacteriia bacterium]|nr:FHA domain-containing protein [Coriobacteriia bacterium]